MNLLQTTNTKKMFTELAKNATSYNLRAEGISKEFQTLKDSIFMFEAICNAAKGELTIISTSMQDKSIYIQFSYFAEGTNDLTNQVRLEANFY